MNKKIAIIMGSDSDLDTAKKCAAVLSELAIAHEMHIMSAHRTPEETANFASRAREAGFGVIIAFAGMAAHLAGVIAAYTTLPVIGVPLQSGAAGSAVNGLDALLATVQMPPGVPVATVAIGGAVNAALLAAEILAVQDAALAAALDERRLKQKREVCAKDARVTDAALN
jgi:5-(carboxyamino)imidazole ribonucleotide mutase